MSNKNPHIINELSSFYSAQNSKEILDFFEHQSMIKNFPFPQEKNHFFENLAHFILEFRNVRFYEDNRNALFNTPTTKTSLYNTVQSFRVSKKEEKYHTLPVLLMELYHRTSDKNNDLKTEIFYLLSNLNKHGYINIHTYTKMEHDKIKPFALDFINSYMENLNFYASGSSRDKLPLIKLVNTILENKLIEDEINHDTATFIARTFNDHSYDSILQKNYSLLYKSRSWISSSFIANHNLTGLSSFFADKSNSWDNMISKVGLKNIYRSHKLIYPEEGFLFNFAEKLDVLSGKTKIEKQHSIFKTLKSLFLQATPEMFVSELDKKSLVDTLSHSYDTNYLSDYINLLEKKSITIDYNLLFMETINNSKRHPEMHVAILKFNKNYSFDVKSINTIWSKIIRLNNILLLNYISDNLPKFPKILQERISIFYGKNLNDDIMEFELLDEKASQEKRQNKLYFHEQFLNYVSKNYDSKIFVQETLPYLKPCIAGEMKSFIENKLITMSTTVNEINSSQDEEIKHRRRI